MQPELFTPPIFPAKANAKFKFIDLFAGVGGFRMALQNLAGQCEFSSEWNKHAQDTYEKNYAERPDGDITLEETKAKIPEKFDILCGGFPCHDLGSLTKYTDMALYMAKQQGLNHVMYYSSDAL